LVGLPELLMKEDRYRNLQQKMVTLTLAVSLAPLLILGMVLYNQKMALKRTSHQCRT
jgi:hypothetical protein